MMSYTDKEIYTDSFVTLEPVKHIYTDQLGRKYTSVSKILSKMQVPFDREGISMSMAKRSAGPGAGSEKIKQEQAKILAEWDKKKDNSIVHGVNIHDKLEEFFTYGRSEDSEINDLCQRIMKDVFSGIQYKRFLPEKIYYDTEELIAGMADLNGIRKESRSSPWILDIFDYKTNIEQGIRFDSIDRRKSPPRHYDEYYVSAFSHVEACNYYKYSMQLSTYAYFAMKRYNVRIGRLGIIFIDQSLQHTFYPVPFMYYEVIALLKMLKDLKELPGGYLKKEKEKTPNGVFDFYNDHVL